MSILQDLDPQYAKIHAQPPSTWKQAILAGTAIIVLGSVLWALMQAQAKPSAPIHTSAMHPSKSSPVTDGIQKSATRAPSPIGQQETTISMTSLSSASATIHEEAPRTDGGEQRRIPNYPTAGSPENMTGSLADTEYRRQKQAAPSHSKANPTQGRATPAHRSTSAQAVAKNEKNQLSGGKRTNERDIDIITAIVR